MPIAIPAIAQDNVQLINIGSETDLSFDGTSNVHDWNSKVTEIEGKGTFVQALFKGAEGELPEDPVKEVTLTIPVQSIESGKGKMNNIMYDALKAEDHPKIEYNLVSSKLLQKTEEAFTLQTEGYLTVAGVKKQISMQVKGEQVDDNTIRFTGAKNLKMTAFKINPPKALFGAIKSGDEVNVKFSAIFSE
ncbi:MAG: YceI family protein [Bacteroidota bacterium]